MQIEFDLPIKDGPPCNFVATLLRTTDNTEVFRVQKKGNLKCFTFRNNRPERVRKKSNQKINWWSDGKNNLSTLEILYFITCIEEQLQGVPVHFPKKALSLF